MYDTKDYINDAIRTRPPQKPLTGELANLVLGAIGMMGEVGEVFEAAETFIYGEKKEGGTEKYLKELGDVLWYSANICEIKHFSMAYMLLPYDTVLLIRTAVVNVAGSFETAFDNMMKDLLKYASAVSEHIKKEVYHRHPPKDEELLQKMSLVIQTLQLSAAMLEFSIESVMERNITKLRERYPERFETSLSLNKKQD